MEYRRTNPNIVEYGRKYQKENRKRLSEQKRERYRDNPSVGAENKRKWREANPEKAEAAQRAWTAANPDYRRQWKQDNAEKVRQASQARRARKADAFVEDVDPAVVFERDEWTCHICSEEVDQQLKFPNPLSVSLDHVVPLAKDGEHSYANCRCSHLGCNCRKHTKILA